MLLTGEVYQTASSGQAVTFIAYGAATVVLATRFSGRFWDATRSCGSGGSAHKQRQDFEARLTKRLPS